MTETASDGRVGYGWVMVAATFVLGTLSFGVLGSVSVFLKPLAAEFGWSRGSLSAGYSALTLATAASAVGWGIVADRYGSRWIAIIGACAMGSALLLLSRMETLVHFYLFYFLFGALGHSTVTGPLVASVGVWFTRNVGLAIGLTVAGGAFGQGTVPLIARYLIDNHGWQAAYAALGIGYLVVALPVSLLVRDSPRRFDSSRDAPARQRDGTLFPLQPMAVVAWISLAVVFCCVAMSVPIVHLVPLLTDNGIASRDAVTVFFVLMMAGAVGRILGGRLADHVGALPGYALMSAAQTSVIFLFPHISNMALMYGVAILFGMFFSGTMASFLVCVRMMVPTRMLARSMATVSMFGWLGMGLGGWQGGAIFDLVGNYNWSFAIGSLAGLVNLLVLLGFYLHIRQGSGGGLKPAVA